MPSASGESPDIATGIEVQVNEGEVTLTGSVDDRNTKWLAEDVAGSVTGVRAVRNELRVDAMVR